MTNRESGQSSFQPNARLKTGSLLQIDKEKINILHTLKSKKHEQAFIEVTLKKNQIYENMLKTINNKKMQMEKNTEFHEDKKIHNAHDWLSGLHWSTFIAEE